MWRTRVPTSCVRNSSCHSSDLSTAQPTNLQISSETLILTATEDNCNMMWASYRHPDDHQMRQSYPELRYRVTSISGYKTGLWLSDQSGRVSQPAHSPFSQKCETG